MRTLLGVRAGRYFNYVSLDAMSQSADTDGTYTPSATPLSPANDWAWIAPATPRGSPLTQGSADVQERRTEAGVESRASIVVRMRYRSDVTTQTRITFGTRKFYVRSVHDPDGAGVELVMACEEVTS